jgi:hypothetical protein
MSARHLKATMHVELLWGNKTNAIRTAQQDTCRQRTKRGRGHLHRPSRGTVVGDSRCQQVRQKRQQSRQKRQQGSACNLWLEWTAGKPTRLAIDKARHDEWPCRQGVAQKEHLVVGRPSATEHPTLARAASKYVSQRARQPRCLAPLHRDAPHA